MDPLTGVLAGYLAFSAIDAGLEYARLSSPDLHTTIEKVQTVIKYIKWAFIGITVLTGCYVLGDRAFDFNSLDPDLQEAFGGLIPLIALVVGYLNYIFTDWIRSSCSENFFQNKEDFRPSPGVGASAEGRSGQETRVGISNNSSEDAYEVEEGEEANGMYEVQEPRTNLLELGWKDSPDKINRTHLSLMQLTATVASLFFGAPIWFGIAGAALSAFSAWNTFQQKDVVIKYEQEQLLNFSFSGTNYAIDKEVISIFFTCFDTTVAKEEICTICTEDTTEVQLCPEKHSFHRECLADYFFGKRLKIECLNYTTVDFYDKNGRNPSRDYVTYDLTIDKTSKINCPNCREVSPYFNIYVEVRGKANHIPYSSSATITWNESAQHL